MSWNPLKAIAALFSTETEEEENHREFAKADIQTRLSDISGPVGEIVDYYVSDVSDTISDTEYQYVFEYESEKYGEGEVYITPPRQGESWSQLHGFMAALDAPAVDALDDVLGEEVELTLAEDGTVSAVWDDPGQGEVFVNTEPEAQTNDDPVIENVYDEDEDVEEADNEEADNEEGDNDQEEGEQDDGQADEESDDAEVADEVSTESDEDSVDDGEVTEEADTEDADTEDAEAVEA